MDLVRGRSLPHINFSETPQKGVLPLGTLGMALLQGKSFSSPWDGAANLFTYQEDGLNKHQPWGQ